MSLRSYSKDFIFNITEKRENFETLLRGCPNSDEEYRSGCSGKSLIRLTL